MEDISLILPCAGKSSRFTGKPKWLKKCPNNNLMIQECIKGLDLINVKNIYMCFLKEHIDNFCKNFNLKEMFNFTKKNIHILILEDNTNSQSESIYKIIEHFNLSGPIFIKDCDNYFKFLINKGNYICSLYINNQNTVNELHNKSFIETNSVNEIINICEKQIISNKICVGGYSFEDANVFKNFFNKCVNVVNINQGELYISHIIHTLLLNNYIFYEKNVTNYIDWGTQKEWNNYLSSFKKLFINLDGLLFYNSSENMLLNNNELKPIKENIDKLKNLYKKKKTEIIITTSRKEESKKSTIELLKKYNIPYDNIIFNLFNSKRYIINNYSDNNLYPSAIAINIKNNSNNLKDFI